MSFVAGAQNSEVRPAEHPLARLTQVSRWRSSGLYLSILNRHMEQNPARPLLTFAILGFNQETYIAEAVRGAFAQTYQPLQIILSDDCSTDGTFSVLQTLTHEYSGPHTVVLNRNHRNLGLGGHINRIMELAQGELVVGAAGDDISLPERTEHIYGAWELSGRKATSIYSAYRLISDDGVILRDEYLNHVPCAEARREPGTLLDYIRTMKPLVAGCTHSWSRRLFSDFGPLRDGIMFEDMALSFRSVAIGGVYFIGEPLVLYRRHDRNLSFHTVDKARMSSDEYDQWERKQRWIWEKYVIGYDGYLHDLQRLLEHGVIPRHEYETLRDEIVLKRRCYHLRMQLITAGLLRKVAILYALVRSREDPRFVIKSLGRLMPYRAYRSLKVRLGK